MTPPQALPNQPQSSFVKDSDSRSFMADVIEASATQPVIVDLWAPWCGPCKQLGPVLEKAVQAAGGRVRMVKVNIDESPEIAQAMRVQSIPAVFVFSQGQPVDGFMGALPESQIQAFVQRCLKLGGETDANDDAGNPASMLKQA
ncbi:MAG TPA: thioredoxin, partial [Alphaproteobacteria bacterium]|nr:thioredoxin [Alphaproteobacteria bacterium]